MSEDNEVRVEEIICQSCSALLTPGEMFCGNCGAKVVYDEVEEDGVTQAPPIQKKRKSKRKTAAELASRRLENRRISVKQDAIKSGRIAIMVVAVLTFLFTLWQYYQFNSEVTAARNNPMMVIDEKVVKQANMIFVGYFAASFLFVGLFFWAKKNPFSACLSALVIYVLSHLFSAIIEPKTIIQGIIVKIIIITVLAKAVAKAAELRAIEQEENL